MLSVRAERALLAELRAGCLAPVGAWGRVVDGRLVLDGVVLSTDGRKRITASATGEPESVRHRRRSRRNTTRSRRRRADRRRPQLRIAQNRRQEFPVWHGLETG